MGGLNSKQIADIKKGKTDVLVITNQRKETLQKKLYTLTSTKAWNLSNNFLCSISPKISSLTLTAIDLSSNDFHIFPAEICKITTLTNLDLSYNFITEVPADIQQLVALVELNISFNRVSDIHDIGKVPSLQVLKASNNYISKIPDSFSNLKHITHISLVHNHISAIPKFTWPSLEIFHASSNQLSQVPFSFLCQPKLRIISLSRNKIHSFPPSLTIAGLSSNLREIYINNNHLSELHSNIYEFPKLELLDLKSNNLSEIPFELFVHSPLIHTLDLSFNPGCKWGMHMPNTFAPPPLIRDIHLSKQQFSDILGRNLLNGGVNSDSENTDSESPPASSTRRSRLNPSLNNISRSPSNSPSSSPSSSPSTSPAMTRRPPFAPELDGSTSSTTTTIATSTARMTTTVITADATDTQIIAPKSRGRSQLGRLGPDENDALKRRSSSKHVKKYVHNKKQFRLVEHDHTVWEQAVSSHASHLAELLVWSGSPCDNVEEEIKKVLLHMTQVRPAQDRDSLRANGITHILIVGAELQPAFPSEFEYYSVSVRDNAIIDDLSIYFPLCQKFIDTGIKKGGVLVHCAAGSSRSASCVMAYLMWKENMSFNDARKELRAIRPIVKTNFYLQLEFYEGVLRGQTKRKPKTVDASVVADKPKMVRSTSLPTIDALHAFKIEKTLEKESELEHDREHASRNAAHAISPHLRLEVPRPPSRTDSAPAGSLTTLPSPPGVSSPTSALAQNMPVKARRASRSLYFDLRVDLPSQAGLDSIGENGAGGHEDGKEAGKEVGKEGALGVVENGHTAEEVTPGGETVTFVVGERRDSDREEVGDGVPSTVMRQASDFEEISEIHQLMRVHSLPELVEDGKQVALKRKLSRGKSFLKNSKINLLDLDE